MLFTTLATQLYPLTNIVVIVYHKYNNIDTCVHDCTNNNILFLLNCGSFRHVGQYHFPLGILFIFKQVVWNHLKGTFFIITTMQSSLNCHHLVFCRNNTASLQSLHRQMMIVHLTLPPLYHPHLLLKNYPAH